MFRDQDSIEYWERRARRMVLDASTLRQRALDRARLGVGLSAILLITVLVCVYALRS